MVTGRWMKCVAVFQALLALANLAFLALQPFNGEPWRSGLTISLITHVVLIGSAPGVWCGNIWAMRAACLVVLGELVLSLPFSGYILYMAIQDAEVFKDSSGTLPVLLFISGAAVLPALALFVSYLAFMVRRARQSMLPVHEDVLGDAG